MLKEVFEHIDKWQKDRIADLKRLHDEAGQRASGQTIESLESSITISGDNAKAKITADEHFGALQYGRSEGKMTPIEVLIDWINDKGLASQFDNERQIESFAWAIAKTHAKDGSFLFREGKTYNGFTDPVLKAFNKEAMKELEEILQGFVLNEMSTEVFRELQFEKITR